MNALKTPSGAGKSFVFSSTEGHALCRRILKELLPYDPHDVQIEGICKVLDNVDLFAVLATGSGKTSFMSMYMLVVLAIQRDPSLCPTANSCCAYVDPLCFSLRRLARNNRVKATGGFYSICSFLNQSLFNNLHSK